MEQEKREELHQLIRKSKKEQSEYGVEGFVFSWVP